MLTLKMETDAKDEESLLNLRIEEDIEKENELLRSSLAHLKSELEKFKTPPLLVAEIKKVLENKAIVKLSNNHSFLVNVTSNILKKLKAGDSVLLEQKTFVVLDKLEKLKNHQTENFILMEKPKITWNDVGGLHEEKKELREVIELPLVKPDIFKKVGIKPPKGVLLHGPPGCGKTLLAKAVANSTNATFIEVVGSELVQKYIGEGAKLVKELFQLAKENAPCIIFIDEIDALATQRFDANTSGEREVQRTFMQMLAEIDGFKSLEDVKIIGATNRLDILDSALLRPGRLDRLIEVNLPNKESRKQILDMYIKEMNLKSVNLTNILNLTENISGAEIKAICTEAGYFAIRNARVHVTHNDFIKAISKVKQEDQSSKDYLKMFG